MNFLSVEKKEMGGVEKGLLGNDDAICPATAKSRSPLHPREPIARDAARMQPSRSSRTTLLSSSIPWNELASVDDESFTIRYYHVKKASFSKSFFVILFRVYICVFYYFFFSSLILNIVYDELWNINIVGFNNWRSVTVGGRKMIARLRESLL